MSKRLVTISQPAIDWWKEELSYIAERNPMAARAISRKLREARRRIAEFPKSGEPWEVPGTRRFVVSPYILIVAEDSSGKPEIVSIAHSRQNYATSYEFEADYETEDYDDGDGGGGGASGGPKWP